jgi:hypothetical protein
MKSYLSKKFIIRADVDSHNFVLAVISSVSCHSPFLSNSRIWTIGDNSQSPVDSYEMILIKLVKINSGTTGELF